MSNNDNNEITTAESAQEDITWLTALAIFSQEAFYLMVLHFTGIDISAGRLLAISASAVGVPILYRRFAPKNESFSKVISGLDAAEIERLLNITIFTVSGLTFLVIYTKT